MQIRVHAGNRSVLSCWVAGRRSWYFVIWRHSCSNIYIKHRTIEKSLIETSNRRCILLLMSLILLRNQGNVLDTNIGARSIPYRCISIKRFSMRSVLTHLPATETVSANWIAVERFKMSQITFISILEESENGSFKFEIDPHQFNLILHHFSKFPSSV